MEFAHSDFFLGRVSCLLRDGDFSLRIELTQHHLIAEELFPASVDEKVGFVASTALCAPNLSCFAHRQYYTPSMHSSAQAARSSMACLAFSSARLIAF
eukprot:COSAG02_NODE_2373_length_9022_cov_6.299675_2_plen_98_part_00